MQAHTTAETSAIHPPTATSLFRNASEVSTLTPPRQLVILVSKH